ncbi:hypothetical protein [Pseudoxanthomonas sangjuensis]|uniref:hypothetical protein n=1 Tax=Pseudoxanthomonas sangjuensis TaxID=1503750 RepID=UPI0013916DCD|nr:hypothetical protein [Pseudoxanthomonas sangjuensis]
MAITMFMSIAVSGCDLVLEERNEQFDSRNEITESGYFEKGWIPRWLPDSATNIREKHEVDTIATVLVFEYSSGDEPPFGNECVATDSERVSAPRLTAHWWPAVAQLKAMPLLYRCPDDNSGFLAASADGKTAYFWRTP